MEQDPYSPLRQMMVQIIASHAAATGEVTGRSAFDPKVLAAMEEVPRHEFVPAEIRAYAHSDGPLPIGFDKTISQPFITALMTDALDVGEDDTVLEIGTGLGYHTAILSRLAKLVYTVEIVEDLAELAWAHFEEMGATNIQWKLGNGYNGWPEHAPYDRIIVAAASELAPPALIKQLKPGGKMVVPAGLDDAQQLLLVEKDTAGKTKTRDILAVRFALLEGVEDHKSI